MRQETGSALLTGEEVCFEFVCLVCRPEGSYRLVSREVSTHTTFLCPWFYFVFLSPPPFLLNNTVFFPAMHYVWMMLLSCFIFLVYCLLSSLFLFFLLFFVCFPHLSSSFFLCRLVVQVFFNFCVCQMDALVIFWCWLLRVLLCGVWCCVVQATSSK